MSTVDNLNNYQNKASGDASFNLRGIASLVLALLIFSLQDIAVKWIGGDYPVLEIVIFRSLVALPCTFLFLRLEGIKGLPATRQPRLEIIRGVLLFLSFTTYMMGLAALPLADIAALRNSGPLMITLLSVIWLGEQVGPRRWLALIVGFVGVLLIVQPGSTTFNLGSVFALLSTLFYALSVMLTRTLRTTESSATMAYYSSLVYLVVAFVVAPLALVVGEVHGAHPSIAFLFRAWAMPRLLVWCGQVECILWRKLTAWLRLRWWRRLSMPHCSTTSSGALSSGAKCLQC